jgi:hypothetical protein
LISGSLPSWDLTDLYDNFFPFQFFFHLDIFSYYLFLSDFSYNMFTGSPGEITDNISYNCFWECDSSDMENSCYNNYSCRVIILIEWYWDIHHPFVLLFFYSTHL